MNEQHPDRGLTLIEVLLVIVVLGLLAAVVTAAADGITARADRSGCESDLHVLQVATEAYFAQHNTDVIPGADATPDGVERTLVAADFLRQVSVRYDLDSSGAVTPAPGSDCTV